MKGRWLLGVAGVMAACSAGAQEAEVEAGADIAARWCGICHVVEGAGSPTDAAPPLPTVAQMRSDDYLRGFLANPHGNMPPIDLTTREIDQLVAYLGSLR
ncbi:MAG: c-type cytochrome [Rhodospirillales bacterium]|nr:c-type cytochrome [Rhodospirillales bacterium]